MSKPIFIRTADEWRAYFGSEPPKAVYAPQPVTVLPLAPSMPEVMRLGFTAGALLRLSAIAAASALLTVIDQGVACIEQWIDS